MQTMAGLTSELPGIAEEAAALEQQGADILSTIELGHDPHGTNFPDKHLDYDIEKGYLLHYRKQDSNKN